MKRKDLQDTTTDVIWNEVIAKHGIRKANILVNEASFKMIKKQLLLHVVLAIQREACIRVLTGQLEAIDINIKDGLI